MTGRKLLHGCYPKTTISRQTQQKCHQSAVSHLSDSAILLAAGLVPARPPVLITLRVMAGRHIWL